MSNPKLSVIAAASALTVPPLADAKLASFTFILESRSGYTAEGYYPNVTPHQYSLIVQVLEGKHDVPQIITGVRA